MEESKLGGDNGIRRIRTPKFDLSVNGNPALLQVLKTADDSSIGRSTLSIIDNEKLLQIHVMVPIAEGGPYYGPFFDFAHQLY